MNQMSLPKFDEVIRYFTSVILGFAILWCTFNIVAIGYYTYAPSSQFIAYYSVRPFGKVYFNEPLFFISDNEIKVNADVVWYDQMWCSESANKPFLNLGTQKWADRVVKHDRKDSTPWRYFYPRIPEWADTCKMSGKVVIQLPFFIKRVTYYETLAFRVYKNKLNYNGGLY